MSLADHIHISERESDGTWEDCTFDSGLEWYRLCVDARKPATHAEAEALRRASGRAMTGGTNLGDFRKGVSLRYGVSLPALVSNRTVLKPGQAAARQGGMKAFGPSHRLSKWQTNFDASHCVLEYKDLDGQLWWCDPLAPKDAAVPVKVTQAEVDAYAKAFAGMALIGTIKNIGEPDMPLAVIKHLPGYTATINPNSNVRVEPIIKSTLVRTVKVATPAKVVATVKGDVDPANGSNVWYMLEDAGRFVFTALDNISGLTAPAPTTGITQAQLDAAVAAVKAEAKRVMDAHLATDSAAISKAKSDATNAEQARVRSVLGL